MSIGPLHGVAMPLQPFLSGLTLCDDLYILRHGESEGNLVHRRARAGDASGITEAFLRVHSSRWALTPAGIQQARNAAAWFQRDVLPASVVRRAVTSPYRRAVETAAELDLQGVPWELSADLRERDQRPYDVGPEREHPLYTANTHARESSPFFWCPPNGVAIADILPRVERALVRAVTVDPPRDDAHAHGGPPPRATDTSRRTAAVLSCHGEVMTVMRTLLEPAFATRAMVTAWANDPDIIFQNCEVLHYTRRSPEDGAPEERFRWMRRVTAGDETPIMSPWCALGPATYTAAALRDLLVLMRPE